MKNTIIAVVLCGVVLFFWGFFSWTVLPWHNATANKFVDESAVAQVLKENATNAGVYYLPFAEEDNEAGKTAAFANVLPEGFSTNMGQMMAFAIVGQFVAAVLVLLLLSQTAKLSYWERVGFVAGVGLTVGFISHFPYWNWFGFSTSYVVVMILDSVIAWFLAGMVMARFVTGKGD